jgi:hypothetical protein
VRHRVRAGPLGATLASVVALVLLFLWLQGAGGPGTVHASTGSWPAPRAGPPIEAEAPRATGSSATGAPPSNPKGIGTANATGNLSASLGRMVLLVSLAAGAVITLAWSRVAVSWFSHDPSRKVQAKERARDALVGSLILVAAVSGLAWGLAQWVLTGV